MRLISTTHRPFHRLRLRSIALVWMRALAGAALVVPVVPVGWSPIAHPVVGQSVVARELAAVAVLGSVDCAGCLGNIRVGSSDSRYIGRRSGRQTRPVE